MGDATKSLAAEIGAILRKHRAQRLITGSEEKMEDAIPQIAAEIAALQSRAFEDGARKGLSEALAGYDASERDLATAEAVYEQMSARVDATAGIGEIMDAVGAEAACMRCLNAEAAAQARLIEAVRAALATTPEGRTDRA
jgi:flagellar biosynthesis/type III secretory pathway protein FliH